MKVIKYITTIVLMAVFSCFTATEAKADYQDKSVQKESKKTAARLEKEGWKVFGNVKSIREGMAAHYKALYDGIGEQTSIEGHGTAKELNMAVRKSQNNAAAQYAAMQESKVEGETDTQVSSLSDDETSTSQVELTSHFRSSTDQLVKSMKPSVVIYRMTNDGNYEVRSFFVVNVIK